ncbi:MAG TPA: hypothetical protein VGO30_03665 [Mycobacterium sp.]|nr:hypothetical protein [Mycobacterium sp.]
MHDHRRRARAGVAFDVKTAAIVPVSHWRHDIEAVKRASRRAWT